MTTPPVGHCSRGGRSGGPARDTVWKTITSKEDRKDATVTDYGSGTAVTFDSGEGKESILDGVSLKNGDNGIYCYYSAPIIRNCSISGNTAKGIYGNNSTCDILNCRIAENSGATGIYDCDGDIVDCAIVENSTGMDKCDGAILDCVVSDNSSYGLTSCTANIDNCVISNNSSYGLYNCNSEINNCHILNNGDDGVYNVNGNSSVTNCVVSGNNDNGIYIYSTSNVYAQKVIVTNCTIIGNSSSGIYFRSYNNSNSILIRNTIIALNKAYGVNKYDSDGDVDLKYNNIWGNKVGNYKTVEPGATDIHSNPRFVVDGYWDNGDSWVEGNYYLKSIAGHWTETIWVNDDITSPCIDAGDPTSGVFNEPTPNGGKINLGAYGGTAKASKSPWGPEPYCTKYPKSDINNDCKVNLEDFMILASEWLECNLEPVSACAE
ncbi:MAG: right-handed parallel beta-helix repeat-containing protein [Phycisphaerae bacterium]|nr:right-handed parallel beta-helix repeat-containing protein [Phycisphaerae bacterium]